MMTWEYKTLAIKPKSIWSASIPDSEVIDKELNELGKNGWELVNTVYDQTALKLIMFFKRPIA